MQECAEKMQTAAAAGDQNAKEWLLDVKQIASHRRPHLLRNSRAMLPLRLATARPCMGSRVVTGSRVAA